MCDIALVYSQWLCFIIVLYGFSTEDEFPISRNEQKQYLGLVLQESKRTRNGLERLVGKRIQVVSTPKHPSFSAQSL